MLNNLPLELKALNRWCVTVPGEKIPAIYENGLWRCISTTEDKENLWDFETAASCVAAHPDRQIGFVLCEGDGFTCVDFDIKDDEPVGGSVFNNRTTLVDEFGRDTYVELSSSGCGYHVWLKGEVKAAIKQAWFEVYSKERFIVCTGNRVSFAYQVSHNQDAISNFNRIADSRQIVATLEDEAPAMPNDELMRRLEAWEHWPSFVSGNWQQLGKSGSDADHMLFGFVAYCTGNLQQAYSVWKETALADINRRYPDADVRRKKAREWDCESKVLRKVEMSFRKCRSAAVAKGNFHKPEDMAMKQEVQQVVERAINNGVNPFAEYSVMNNYRELHDMVKDAKYLDADDEFLAFGQTTIFFARSNVGKTFISAWLLEQAHLKGKDLRNVTYIDADNGVGQAIGRVRALQDSGMNYIIPKISFNDKVPTVEGVKEIMQQLIDARSTGGHFLIIDTLKKFADIMNKREYSKFMDLCRQFTAGGGGILLLTHTNKHKTAEGKEVMSGTADGLQDADCVFSMERISDVEPGYDHVVFEAEKVRLPVTRKATFKIKAASCMSRNTTYDEMSESICRLDSDEADKMRMQTEKVQKLAKDKDLIDVIQKFIAASIRPGASTTDAQGVFVANLRAHLQAEYPHLDKSDKPLRNFLKDGDGFYWREVKFQGSAGKGYAPLSSFGSQSNT